MKQPVRLTTPLGVVAAAALLVACAGDGPDRGGLKEEPKTVVTLSAAQIDAATAASGLQALSGKAKCDVKVVSLYYDTPGAKGEDSDSSGVMLVPGGSCTAAAPLLAYARGTEVYKPRELAKLTNGQLDSETFLLAAMYAAQGYAVVAPDYLGFARSTYSYHPYLHADSEADTVLDALRAARRSAASVGANLSGKVLLSGYSQGGHASMAAHRALERDAAAEFTLAGAAHLAGPYNLATAIKAADLNNPIAGYQFFIPFIITSWQKVYGDVYSKADVVFKAPYASTIESLLPNPTLTYTTLVTTGALPGGTPKQAQDALMQTAYLTDMTTNDANGVYVAAKKNTLLGWNPKAATMLCGGAGDPTVPPVVHQAPAVADFASRGVTVTTVDVDPQVRALYGTNGAAPTDPTAAATYYGNYHGTYEPPLCHASAKAFFDAQLAK